MPADGTLRLSPRFPSTVRAAPHDRIHAAEQLTVRSPAYYRVRIIAFAAFISAKSMAYVADSRLPGPAKSRQWFRAPFFGVLPLRPTVE